MTGATDLRVIAGRYALEDLVGKGGMGEVWRARHLTLKSKVAIKFLHAATASSETSRRRFLTEAQVTANLKSKHAVQVFDFGVTDDGMPYLVMELLEGETLDRRIARLTKLNVRATVRILRQAARALDRAHALGIVHRDFKPENIVILQDDEGHDEVKILDFGVAKLVGELEPGREPSASDADDLRKPSATTRTGTVVGTPYYMAPEQIKDSSQVGPSADIWALGIVAYECLTGQRPFENETVAAVLRDILEGKFTPATAHDPSLPPMFDEWFQAACAPAPGARFSDALTAVVALGISLDDSGDRGGASKAPPKMVGGNGPHIKTHWSALAETMNAEPATSTPLDEPSRRAPNEPAPTPGEVPPATAVTTARSSRRTKRLRALLYTLAAVSLVGLGMVVRPTPTTTTYAVADDPPPADHATSPPLGATVPVAQIAPPRSPEGAGTPAPRDSSPRPAANDAARAAGASATARATATASASASAAAAAPPSATATASAAPSAAPSSKPTAPSPFKLPDLGL